MFGLISAHLLVFRLVLRDLCTVFGLKSSYDLSQSMENIQYGVEYDRILQTKRIKNSNTCGSRSWPKQ